MSRDDFSAITKRAAVFEAKYMELDADYQPLYVTALVTEAAVHPGHRGPFYTKGAACETLLQL